MLKSEVLKYSKKYAEEFEEVYTYIKSLYNTDYVEEVAKLRGYVDDKQLSLIKELEIGCCNINIPTSLSVDLDKFKLITSTGNFLLNDRYIIPIRSITGQLVALVGWYPDYKKYITTPTPFFSKEVLFFNIDNAYKLSWDKFDGLVFLVEGMFDCLSLRALGLPCISTMGITLSKIKGEQLKLFRKVVGIPDADKAGVQALNRYSSKGWKVPSNTTLVKLVPSPIQMGSDFIKAKDIDNFVSWYDNDSVIECLMQFKDSHEEIETLYI